MPWKLRNRELRPSLPAAGSRSSLATNDNRAGQGARRCVDAGQTTRRQDVGKPTGGPCTRRKGIKDEERMAFNLYPLLFPSSLVLHPPSTPLAHITAGRAYLFPAVLNSFFTLSSDIRCLSQCALQLLRLTPVSKNSDPRLPTLLTYSF